MKTIRDVATPMVFGAFLLMSATGVMMFFHVNAHLHEELHEWAGFVMVAAAIAHIVANVGGFKKHWQLPGLLPVLVAVVLAVVGVGFIVDEEGEGPSPPAIAIGAVEGAPLAQVAPLFGVSAAAAKDALAAAGVAVADENASIASATKGDREATARALRALAALKLP